MHTKEKFISIIIPSKNSEKTVRQVLTAIFNQRINNFEVIVIDSGSKDNTLTILKEFPIRLHQIQPHEFGHGKTRNLGAELASGDILVFLNSDAIPVNKLWLELLIEPLNDPEIAASFSRHIPYARCNPAEKLFIVKSFPPFSKTLSCEDLKNDLLSRLISFSSVSGALKKGIWKEIRFREDVVGAEDNDIGLRTLNGGRKIRYCAESKVMHSHNFTIKTVFKKYLEYGFTYREEKIILSRSSAFLWKTIRYFNSLVSETLKYVVKVDGASKSFSALLYTFAKALGFLIGYSSLNMPKCIRTYLMAQTWTTSRKKC